MTWPARTWVAGETITASLGNNYWRDPLTDLRAGGVAIASQAANDFLYASSATQLARLAAASSRTPRFNGSAWEMFNMAGQVAWPVGSIYEAVVSTNPNTLLGFGTWAAYGTGRIMVAIDGSQTEFDTLDETGGAKTVTISTAELPVHTHVQTAHTHTQDSHNHTQDAHDHSESGIGNLAGVGLTDEDQFCVNNAGTKAVSTETATNIAATAVNQSTTATNQATGSGGAHTNLQPYIVVYRWKRTA